MKCPCRRPRHCLYRRMAHKGCTFIKLQGRQVTNCFLHSELLPRSLWATESQGMKSQLPTLTCQDQLTPQAAILMFQVTDFFLVLAAFFHLFREDICKTKCSISQSEKESCWPTLNQVPSRNIYLSSYLLETRHHSVSAWGPAVLCCDWIPPTSLHAVHSPVF